MYIYELASSKASAGSASCDIPPPKIASGRPSGLSYSIFVRFSKFRLPKKRSKISEKWSRNVFNYNFNDLLDPIWHHFSIFHDSPKTLVIRNACFCFSGAPILASKICLKNMFFQNTFLDTPFDDLMLVLCEKYWFWAPLQNPVGAKAGPKNGPSGVKKLKKRSAFFIWGGPGTDLFPTSIRIEV